MAIALSTVIITRAGVSRERVRWDAAESLFPPSFLRLQICMEQLLVPSAEQSTRDPPAHKMGVLPLLDGAPKIVTVPKYCGKCSAEHNSGRDSVAKFPEERAPSKGRASRRRWRFF